jgi:2-amino-4-hydroxy-6-hydroxymethyldihydropteridine diphosphokinase
MPDRHLIYLSLGSNLGDRAANLECAIDALRERGVAVLRRSAFYETEPVDFLAQPWFVNCVLEAETTLSPAKLLDELQGIELGMGSQKLIPKGPRLIDIDILFYDENIVSENGIEIPHPRMAARRFVLVPLAELVPELMHPVRHKTIAELLASSEDDSIVRIWQAGGSKFHST